MKIKEYPMKIVTTHGVMTQEQLDDYNATAKESEEKHLAETKAAEALKPTKDCPFFDGMDTRCRLDCALYDGGRCRLSGKPPEESTEGKICPFGRYRQACRKGCMLFNNGCTMGR